MVGTGWQRLMAVAACASFVGVAACGGGDGSAGDTVASGGEVARDTAAAATTPGAAATPGAATSPAGGATMSITGGDAEILQVLAAVDQAEIGDGRLAQQRARNAQVKAFARELVTSHQRSLQKDRQLAKSQNVQLMAMDSTAKGGTGTDTNRSATGATGASMAMGTPS